MHENNNEKHSQLFTGGVNKEQIILEKRKQLKKEQIILEKRKQLKKKTLLLQSSKLSVSAQAVLKDLPRKKGLWQSFVANRNDEQGLTQDSSEDFGNQCIHDSGLLLLSAFEEHLISNHEHILKDLINVRRGVEQLKSESENLNSHLAAMENHLVSHDTTTKDYREKVLMLSEALDTVDRKQHHTIQFLQNYQLHREEKQILNPLVGKQALGPKFFQVLKKVHDVKERCEAEIRNFHGGRRLVIEIMEEMSMYLDSAYGQISQWIQESCKSLANPDEVNHEEIERDLSIGIHALFERPSLLDFCLKEFVSSRKELLVQNFFDLIDNFQRKDPVQLFSDILIWIHKQIAYEKMLLEILFAGEKGISTAKSKTNSKQQNLSSFARISLCKIFDGLSSHLNQQFQNIIALEDPPLGSYFQIAHLLNLYESKVDMLLGEKSEISLILCKYEEICMESFSNQLDQQSKHLSIANIKITKQCDVPSVLVESTQQLCGILSTFTESMDSSGPDDLANILTKSLDPMLTLIDNTVKSSVSPIQENVFIVNCLDFFSNELSNFQHTLSHIDKLQMTLNNSIETIIQLKGQELNNEYGLEDIVSKMKNIPSDKTFSEYEDLSEDKLTNYVQSLYQKLFQQNDLLHNDENCKHIHNNQLQKYVRNRILQDFFKLYEELYNQILDKSKTGYSADPGDIVFHDKNAIRELLHFV